MNFLDDLMRHAFRTLQVSGLDSVQTQEVSQPLKNPSVKGVPLKFAARMTKRASPSETAGSMALTKVRKKVARLHELQRLLQRVDPQTDRADGQLQVAIRQSSAIRWLLLIRLAPWLVSPSC